MECLPCKHHVTITYEDESTEMKLLNALQIRKLLIENNLYTEQYKEHFGEQQERLMNYL